MHRTALATSAALTLSLVLAGCSGDADSADPDASSSASAEASAPSDGLSEEEASDLVDREHEAFAALFGSPGPESEEAYDEITAEVDEHVGDIEDADNLPDWVLELKTFELAMEAGATPQDIVDGNMPTEEEMGEHFTREMLECEDGESTSGCESRYEQEIQEDMEDSFGEGTGGESPSEGDDGGQPGTEGGHGGTSVDDPMGGTYQVGDTFEFYGTDGASSMQVTWDATEWVETEDGKDAAILVLSADNTEGSTVVDHHYPTTDGGGWHYRAQDGEMESLLDQQLQKYDTTFEGTVGLFGTGDGVAPGSKESGQVLWTIAEDRGGDLAYMSPMNEYLLVLDLGRESVNSDHETVQQIRERAEQFDEVFIEPG